MPDIRVRYVIDTDSLVAAQAAMQGLTTEEKQAVETFKKVNEEAVKAGKATEAAAKKADEALKHTRDSAGRVRDEFGKFVPGAKKAEAAFGSLGNAAKSVGGAIAAYFTVTALIDFGKQVIAVTSEFQKFQAVLTNTLGSQTAAAVAMQKISDFAAKTNFSVKELTEAYVKFANRGIKLSTEELRKLADLANSTGKSFDQLTEAVLDSFTGENERLKEFGIIAKKTGETTQFTFKGITTEVKNTDEAVKAYLLSLGDLEGVSGSTAAISATLGGQISNLGDAFDQLFVTIGTGSNGVLSFFITQLTDYVNWVKNALKSTEQFNEEISNIRADKFISVFKTLGEAGRMEQESSVRADIQLQTTLINKLEAARAGVVRTWHNAKKLDETDRQIEQLKLDLSTNEKRLELIKAYYKDEAKETDESEVKLTDKQKKANEKKLKEEEEYWKKRRKLGQEQIEALQQQAEELSLSALKSREDAEKAAEEKEKNRIERMKKENKDIQDLADAQQKENERREKDHQDRVLAIKQAAFDVASELASGLFQLASQNREAEIQDINTKREQELKRVGDDAQAKAFINAKFDRQEAAIKTRQAQADKAQAIFGVLINTASAIVKQLSVTPLPIGAPFVAAIAAIGAIQGAVIAARPIPKFREGVIDLDGPGTSTSDSIMARLSKGESVMTAKETQTYRPALEAMRAGFNPDLLNKVAMMNYDAISRQVANNSVGINSESIEEAVSKGVAKAMKKIPLNHISMDEKGFRKFVFTGDSTTQILNNQFNR